MVWSLVLSLVLFSSPAVTDEGIEVVNNPLGEVITLDQTDESDEIVTNEVQQSEGNAEEKDSEEEVSQDTGEDETHETEGVSSKQLLQSGNDEDESITVSSVKALGDRASVTFSAYANMNPSSTYALYAEGLLKEVGQDESYCLVQDSNASYAFVVGKADSISSFSDARWWRWYNTTGYGWRLERGSGNASVNAGSFQVISNLKGYPSLVTEVQEVFRREVMFYALVATCVFCLASVWGFSIRVSQNS